MCKSAFMLVFGLAILVFPMGAAGQPDGPIQTYGYSITNVALQQYFCDTVACTGIRLLNPNGQGLVGCRIDRSPTQCDGKCSFCVGDGSARACRGSTNPADQCIPGGAPSTWCGTIYNNQCQYSANFPFNIPCWCPTIGGGNSGISCDVANCN